VLKIGVKRVQVLVRIDERIDRPITIAKESENIIEA